MPTTVLLAGATGLLGSPLAEHLLDQPDVQLRLLLRASSRLDANKATAVDSLVGRGATVVTGDLTDPASLDRATAGVDVVVSALQGGADVIVDGQVALAEAAVRNGVRRFLPSDFALDLFQAPAGAPMFDLRKQAARAIDAMRLEVVHVLNGAFMDMMLDPRTAGLVDLVSGTATLWGTGDEPFDLTTVDDTARFTARVATDPADVSGIRYVSGSKTTFNTIIGLTEQLTGSALTRNVLGSVEDLRRITADADEPWSVIRETEAGTRGGEPAPPRHRSGTPITTSTGHHPAPHGGAGRQRRPREEDDMTSNLQDGYAYAPGDSPAYWNFGTYWRMLATSDTTKGRSTTFDELFPAGVVAPPHVHDQAEEAFFVLEGDLVFTLGDDDEEILAPPGTYVYIPPGVRHSFRCGSAVGRVHNTLVPGGFDHGIVEHGTPAPQVVMPAPGTSALAVWEEISAGRPPAPWQGDAPRDVSSW